MRGNSINTGTTSACTAIEILLASHVSGELDLAEKSLVEDHLACCQLCQAELAREIYLRQTLETLPLVKCPPRVTRSLLQEIDHPEANPMNSGAKNSLSRQWTSYLGWAAAAAAVVLLVINPLGSKPEDPANAAKTEVAAAESYSPEEIAAAKEDLKRGLLLTAAIINRTERSTVKEVFGEALPNSISRTLKTIMTTPEGEQG